MRIVKTTVLQFFDGDTLVAFMEIPADSGEVARFIILASEADYEDELELFIAECVHEIKHASNITLSVTNIKPSNN